MIALTFRDYGSRVAAYDWRGEYQGRIICADACAYRVETVARSSVTNREYHLTDNKRYPSLDAAKHALVSACGIA